VSRWRWVAPAVLYALHERQLAEHGGQEGIRELNAIESALARPQQLFAYSHPDAAALAAAYAFGLARNHGFVDGNKRVAWVVARLFLADNGYTLRFEAAEAVRLMEALAAGSLEEGQLAQWLREHLG